MVKRNVKLGKNVKIFHRNLVNLYDCTIGDNTRIGAFVEIKSTAKIGKNCKIMPFVFIPEGVTIEDGVFVGPNVTFTNDKYPKATNTDGSLQKEGDWTLSPILVKQGATLGAGSVILPGVTIGRNAMVGAGAVVTKDVPDNATVVGYPARPINKKYKRVT